MIRKGRDRLAMAAVAWLAFAGAVQAGAAGGIAGTVRQAGSAAAVAEVQIRVLTAEGFLADDAVSNAAGQFDTGATLAPGDYLVLATSPGHLKEWWGGAHCGASCPLSAATPITVTAAGSSLADFELDLGGAIAGRVTGPDGQPPVSAEIHVYAADFQDSYYVPIGADGRYDTGHRLPPGSYKVRTAAAGLMNEAWNDVPCPDSYCQSAGGILELAAGQKAADIDFALARGASLSGTVTRASDGAPLANRSVIAVGDGGIGSVSVSTDAAGHYRTPALPPGTWRAMVLAQDGLLGEAWNDRPCGSCLPSGGDPIAVAASDIAGIDFALDTGGSIAGRLSDAGSGGPVAGLWARVYDADGNQVSAAQSQADGSYATAALVPGAYFVHVGAEQGYLARAYGAVDCEAGCAPRDGAPVAVPAGTQVAGIDIALVRGATIAGRVREAGGLGIADARVFLYDAGHRSIASVAPGADGSYQFGGVPPGSYALLANAAEHVRTTWPDRTCAISCSVRTAERFEVAAGQARAGMDIVMERGARIQGRVTAAQNGAPLADVVVDIELAGTRQVVAAYLTDANGEYASNPLPARDYHARVTETGEYVPQAYDGIECLDGCPDATPAVLAPRPGADVTADFALARGGRIAANILQAGNGAPLPSQPMLLVMRADGDWVEMNYAAEDGSYLGNGLPAGTYYLRTINFEGFLDELYDGAACFWCVPGGLGTPVTVTTGATAGPYAIALARGPRLRGRVTVNGQSPGALYFEIRIHDASGKYADTAFATDADGHWQTDGAFPPGTYYVRVRSFGRFHDEAYGGMSCDPDCDLTRSTPVTVQAAAVEGIDFDVTLRPVFANGFEGP